MQHTYIRMYETRNVRPYYTVPHLGIFGEPLKELVGFEYKKIVYITSPEMNNAGYFDVSEMHHAGEFFDIFWKDTKRVRLLLTRVKENFNEASIAEKSGWKQHWSTKKTEELIQDMQDYYGLMFTVFGTMIISQPQHVSPLERRITQLLEKYPNKESMLAAATYYEGDLPWAVEDRIVESLHHKWSRLSTQEKDQALNQLVTQFGWFNNIEGDQPFDAKHYEEKISSFKVEKKPDISGLVIPPDIRDLGQLIGELGFLRLWNRYHFMHLRYHLKNILHELTKRSGNDNLEFATIEEIGTFFATGNIDLEEIAERKNGYASYLENGKTKIVTGQKANEFRALTDEGIDESAELRGNIANKGKVVGRVRVISFTAADYNEQVAAFTYGEVLVTGMTRPQIVHLCKKAAAIITDEGGITSHAAVVSREFNVPCIIATHNATKLLKTGDLVEVDANTGVIHRL